MKIKFWGARGSIPVSGKQYLKYGGDTTCIEVRDNDNDLFIVDAGTGIRVLGKEIIKEKIKSFIMLFTHSHWDHIIGFPFFAPIYCKDTRIRVMGCSFSSDAVREIVAKTMQPPGFPVKFEEISVHFEFNSIGKEGRFFGEMKVTPIEISHPNQGLGYKFEEKGKKFVFLTDNELYFQHSGARSMAEYVEFASGADLLVHDADYTQEEYKNRKTWGHSTYIQALELAMKGNVRSLGFFHHNQDRSDLEIDKIVRDSRKTIKSKGMKMNCFAVFQGQEIKLGGV